MDFTGLERRSHDWESGVYRWPAGAGGAPGPTLLYELPPRPGGRNHWEVSGERGRTAGEEVVVLESSGGRLSERRYAMQRESETVNGVEALARMRLPADPTVVWENPYAQLGIPGTDTAAGDKLLVDAGQLVDFYHAIVDGRAPGYGAAAARRDLELLIALRESARHDSAPVSLPLRAETQHERHLHATYRETYGHDPVDDWRESLAQLYPRGGITHGVTGAAR